MLVYQRVSKNPPHAGSLPLPCLTILTLLGQLGIVTLTVLLVNGLEKPTKVQLNHPNPKAVEKFCARNPNHWTRCPLSLAGQCGQWAWGECAWRNNKQHLQIAVVLELPIRSVLNLGVAHPKMDWEWLTRQKLTAMSCILRICGSYHELLGFELRQ